MREEVILIVVSSLAWVHCHLYTDTIGDAGSAQHCKDDTCVTDERPCFIPRENGILTRLDGVRVSNHEGDQKTFLLCRFICYIYSSIKYFDFGWVIFIILLKSMTREKIM